MQARLKTTRFALYLRCDMRRAGNRSKTLRQRRTRCNQLKPYRYDTVVSIHLGVSKKKGSLIIRRTHCTPSRTRVHDRRRNARNRKYPSDFVFGSEISPRMHHDLRQPTIHPSRTLLSLKPAPSISSSHYANKASTSTARPTAQHPHSSTP